MTDPLGLKSDKTAKSGHSGHKSDLFSGRNITQDPLLGFPTGNRREMTTF